MQPEGAAEALCSPVLCSAGADDHTPCEEAMPYHPGCGVLLCVPSTHTLPPALASDLGWLASYSVWRLGPTVNPWRPITTQEKAGGQNLWASTAPGAWCSAGAQTGGLLGVLVLALPQAQGSVPSHLLRSVC